jgi:hypothetical protein
MSRCVSEVPVRGVRMTSRRPADEPCRRPQWWRALRRRPEIGSERVRSKKRDTKMSPSETVGRNPASVASFRTPRPALMCEMPPCRGICGQVWGDLREKPRQKNEECAERAQPPTLGARSIKRDIEMWCSEIGRQNPTSVAERPLQYALETDSLAEAAGFEPPHQESCAIGAYRYRARKEWQQIVRRLAASSEASGNTNS